MAGLYDKFTDFLIWWVKQDKLNCMNLEGVEKAPEVPEGKKRKPRRYRKSKNVLSKKEQQFMKALAVTDTAADAAKMVYNTEKWAAQTANSTLARIEKKIGDVLIEAGVTNEKLAGVLLEALSATHTYYSKALEDYIYPADWQSRLKAVDILAKLKDLYPKQQIETEHNVTFRVVRGDEPVKIEAVRATNQESDTDKVD